MINVYISLVTTFVVATFGAANIPTNGGTKCNNYIAFDAYDNDRLVPVGQCYSENNNEWQTDPSNDIAQYFAQNMMFKCEMQSDGQKKACLYRMNIGCTEEIDESTLCYPCNGVEDQCECQIGGDASECQFYEKKTYDTVSDGLQCNKDSYTIQRSVVNMCIQGSSTGRGATYNQEYACGGITERGDFHADYVYNNGMARSSADCSDAPSPAPTVTVEPSASPTTNTPFCFETTCAGVESPRADLISTTTTTTDEPDITGQYDMIFLLDSSSGVSYDSFLDQMEFVGILNDCFETYDHTTPKLSVMTYGDKVRKLSDLDMISEDDMIGGNRWADEALASALEQFEESGGSDKVIVLVLNGAPMLNHEPCLDGGYLSPTLQKLRNMGVQLSTIGINLDEEEMNNLLCVVPEDMRDEINIEDYLVNTDTMVNLAQEWGYTDCANGLHGETYYYYE